VATAKKTGVEDGIVFLAIRIPKSMKRQLQQLALDQETTVQALVRRAITAELDRHDLPKRKPRL
jgi:predicted transcriptional regulator